METDKKKRNRNRKNHKKTINSESEVCGDKIKFNDTNGDTCLDVVKVSEKQRDATNFLLNSLLTNDKLKALFNQSKLEDIVTGSQEESEDELEETIEFVFHPRQYFLQSLCQLCKECPKGLALPCPECNMVYYCTVQHMKEDRVKHLAFCTSIKMIASQKGGHVYDNSGGYTNEEFQVLRINTISSCEQILNRPLEPFEKEALLFPRLCSEPNCRKWQWRELDDCKLCKQATYCKSNPDHHPTSHKDWCKQLKLFEKIITHQSKFGKIRPKLPSKMLKDSTANLCSISQVLAQIYDSLSDISNIIYYSELTQIASPSLTAWFALKLTNIIQQPEQVIHIIGAEQHFEVDTIQKWELFLLHLVPELKKLDIVFVGPELNINDMQVEVLQNLRLCKPCQKQGKEINYYFENRLYHDYVASASYKEPSLVSYYNPGLYRSTGFNVSDTWPETIRATANANCPVLVTSYTNYESVLDLKTILRECDRPVEVILPAVVNPFRSQRPERNFVSEHQAPLIYKNYYLFVLK